MPVGILAVYFVIRADTFGEKGDIIASERFYRHAELTCAVGIILGLMFYLAYFGFFFFVSLAGAASEAASAG